MFIPKFCEECGKHLKKDNVRIRTWKKNKVYVFNVWCPDWEEQDYPHTMKHFEEIKAQ